MFEKETINLYQKLKEKEVKGPWQYSPVEKWKIDYFSENLNEKNLANFRRNSLSDGLISFPDRPLKYDYKPLEPWFSGIPFFQKIRGVRDISKELLQLRKLFKFKLSDVSDNLVGNPCYYKWGKSYITDFAIRMFMYSGYLSKNVPEAGSVLEIGGGFGGLCSKLMSSNKNIKKYVLVDLPESLALSWWYLKNSGFEVSAFVSSEDEIKDNIAVVAPWMLDKVSLNFDLLINTMSFQHMNKDNINYYFNNIDRLNIKNLYLVNRDTIRDETDTKMSEYPIPEKYKLTKKEDYPFSKHIMKIYSI